MSKIYLTTAIPYVNGAPHIGHAMDYLIADTYSRYHKLIGDEVKFQAGTDEHGNKIFQKAADLGVPVQEYVDTNAQKFQDFIHLLGVEYTDFIRTTDPDHERRCQAIWQKLAPHIYSADYEGWYCTGCEGFVTQKEYDENHGICPDHQKPYEKLSEKNYYLKISDFKDQIRAKIEQDELKILPDFRKKEVLRLLEDTPDVSISRPKSQLTWGIPVPDDDTQVMYVWIDALANYITILGYPEKDISEWWPASAQFVGKDILRFHAIIWPAMLLALDLPLPKVLCSHGHVLSNGQKMSKSLGNVIDPLEVLNKHGVDAFRYFFLRHIDTFADSDFTWDKFESAYNNELANDLGNLVQRLTALVSKGNYIQTGDFSHQSTALPSDFTSLMDNFEFAKAFDFVWAKIQDINKKIDEVKPWEVVKTGDQTAIDACLAPLIQSLKESATLLDPFMPTTAEKITELLSVEKIIPPAAPLFLKTK